MLGIISGIVSIIFGIISYDQGSGYWVNLITYGGDAYTGIQNAAAYTAINVRQLCRIVEFGFCALLIVIGLAIIAFFLGKLLSALGEKITKGKTDETESLSTVSVASVSDETPNNDIEADQKKEILT